MYRYSTPKALCALLVVLLAIAGVRAQQVGTYTPEYHPPLSTQSCTSSGCETLSTSIVIDSNWRWVHDSTGTNCYTGNSWDATLCPDPVTCAANCALEGVAASGYTGTYGVTSSGDELTLGFVTGTNVGSRTYLMEDTNTYQIFNLKNREFAVDVDVSNLPCGLNGALYFVEMEADGGLSEYSGNKAGAEYGTGYCDAQCPQDIKFIDGEANVIDWNGSGLYGTCCNELDIWEANSISNALTPHPCSVVGQTMCNGTECTGLCDSDGCDYNPYRMGNQTFFGPDMTIDTTQAMTVVTQFITVDGTDTGDLSEIRRFYVQNGAVFSNSYGNFAGVTSYNSISDDFCAAQKSLFGDANTFSTLGGMQAMGDSMDRGMVLVMSLWDDSAAECLWLDSLYPTTSAASMPGVARGSCPITSGVPSVVEAEYPSASVTFSNIKVGTLGSTTAGVAAPSGSSTAAPTSAPTAAPSKPTAAPTQKPTAAPTEEPTAAPTKKPKSTEKPTAAPTEEPTAAPTKAPAPTHKPKTTSAPVIKPTSAPTAAPTSVPTAKPTAAPTAAPTHAPTAAPTSAPTAAPTATPINGCPGSSSAVSADGCDASNIHISQSSVNSWAQGSDTVVQYGVFVTSSCTTGTLTALTLTATNWNPISGGYWGFTAEDGVLELPAPVSVTPATPLTWLGYQNIGGVAEFTVDSFTFQ